ncbi:MAG: hypothetical protein LBD78_06295, partial [Spirochaetaceae bacterium]|nr:hypothetical protein [Spirochaetaceae bacterium]
VIAKIAANMATRTRREKNFFTTKPLTNIFPIQLTGNETSMNTSLNSVNARCTEKNRRIYRHTPVFHGTIAVSKTGVFTFA